MQNGAHEAQRRTAAGPNAHSADDGPPLTVGEFAIGVNISRRHAAGLVASGKVASIRIGKCRRIPRSELARVLREGVQ